MKILVLSQLVGSPGTEVFLDAARAAGHEPRLANPLHARIVVGSGEARIEGLGDLDVDLVFTRMGGATPERGFDVLRHLELRGIPCINRAGALRIARDKLKAYLELDAAGLALPRTVAASGNASAAELADMLGPPPWVWKHPVGTKGQEVERIETLDALREAMARTDRFLLQEFVADAHGADVRVLVVGGRAVAAMRRVAGAGEWRSNLFQGGSGAREELTPELVSIAEGAATVLDLDVAGVDLLPSSNGPLIAEVNGSPGLAGLQAAVGDGPATEILRLLESRL